MNRSDAPHSWRDEPICLVPYDPSWPARFESERVRLSDAVEPWATGGIHHVGSTAVPGLDSKPIIDILVGIEDNEVPREYLERLAALGYVHAPYLIEEMHWFCKPDPRKRTHHLHLVSLDSPRFRDELVFRDQLRSQPQIAREYSALKHRLAEQFRFERDSYTLAKGGFICGVVRDALSVKA